MNRKIPRNLKVGDLVIWEDDSIGILAKRFDMYANSSRPTWPTWCWRIEFPNGAPANYNERYGEGEINLKNRNKIKEIISC